MPKTGQTESEKHNKTIAFVLSQDHLDQCDTEAQRRRWSRSSYIRWCIEQQAPEPGATEEQP